MLNFIIPMECPMNNRQYIAILIIIIIGLATFVVWEFGFNNFNGVFTGSNFNLTLNEKDNYTLNYDLTPNRDVDFVLVEFKFYNSNGSYVIIYTKPLSNLKKGHTYTINEQIITKSSDSSVEATPKTVKVFVMGRYVIDSKRNQYKITLVDEYDL